MSEKPTGGAAFPWCGDLNACPTINLGMSKREYFAAHAPITFSDAVRALESAGAERYTGSDILEMLALMRWDYADKMIAGGAQ